MLGFGIFLMDPNHDYLSWAFSLEKLFTVLKFSLVFSCLGRLYYTLISAHSIGLRSLFVSTLSRQVPSPQIPSLQCPCLHLNT